MKILQFRFCFPVLLLFGFSVALQAQGKKITGTVTSSQDKQPIPGVTVVVSGTTIGTITNLNGLYTIKVPPGADSLEFRSVGMQTQRVAIGNLSTINIVLKPELYSLNKVVVTALGISRQAKSLGYSVTAVNSKELNRDKDRSVLNALEGKVAGVDISSASGAPGASTRVLIRGISSLTGSNQPLFIVDGVPVSNSQSGSSSINGGTDFGNKINDINPEDIASISVLKGASGTALYGSRAANGVIIITTKSGKKNTKSQISVNSSVTLERPLRLVKYQNSFGQGLYGNTVLYENTSWGPAFDYRYRPWGHNVDSSLRVKAYRPLPNNVKEFFETGKSYNNSVSISGGTALTTYYFSFSNVNWNGIFPTPADSYKKNTLSLRSSHTITKRFKTTTSINYIHKKSSFVPTGQGEQSVYNQVMQTPRDISLLELSNLNEKWNSIDNYYSLYTVNPYYILKHNSDRNVEDRVYGSIDFDYTLPKGIALKWRVGGDESNEHQASYRERVQPTGNNENASVFDPGLVSRSSSNQYQINSDLILTYKLDLKNWNFNFLAGHSLNQRSASGMSAAVSYLSLPAFNNLSNSTEKPSAGNSVALRRNIAVYGSSDISYKSMLFFSATARNEWSSTLPLQNNSYFFPGANVGFIFSELFSPSLKKILPYGKIRASWARVGNDAPPYEIYSVFQQGSQSDGYGYLSFPLPNGANSYDVGDLITNKKLKPELTDSYEFGADLRFFDDRFSIDADYYNKATTDLIWPSPVPYSSGYRYQMQNLGKLTNYGVEALVGFEPVRNNKFSWKFTVNFTRNINKLNYLNNSLKEAVLNSIGVEGGQQINWVAIPGQPVGVFKARTVKRTADGKIVVNNKGLPVAAKDLKIYGNSQYKYYGGASTTLTYGNLSLSMNFDFRQGGIMYSRTKDICMFAGTIPLTLYNDRKPFIIPNSVVQVGTDKSGNPIYAENSKPIDRVNLVDYWGNGGLQLDGASLISKSFVKLREVVLSYSIPDKWVKKLHLGELSFSIIGKNLLLWTPPSQTYIDPEATTFGNDLLADFGEYGAQPSTRSVTFNLAAKF